LENSENAKFYQAKLKELKALWWIEAKKYQVLPLNFNTNSTVAAAGERPSPTKGRNLFVFSNGIIRIPEGIAPNMKNTSYTISAEIEVPESGAEGVIVTQGGRFAGWGLFALNNKPVWCYKRSEQEGSGIVIFGEKPLSPGSCTVQVQFDYDYPPATVSDSSELVGRGGTFTLKVDDVTVAQATIDKTVPAAFSIDETFDVGMDTGTPIYESYADRMPFAFNSDLRKVTVELQPADPNHPMAKEIEEEIERAKARADLATE
jgi:arylsulfatase